MKYILIITLTIAITACNGQPKQMAADDAAKAADNSASASVSSPSGGCSSLALFHKGAVITGTTYDSAGKEISSSVTTVTDVSSDNGVNISKVTMAYNSAVKGHPIEITYKCDGNNLYVDMGSLMGNFGAMKEAKVESKPMAFPINMSSGQTLPDADITVTMPRAGMNMKITNMVRNRKVLGKETITTPAGTWSCYKVTSTIESKTDIDATTEAGKKMQEVMKKTTGSGTKTVAIMWFAPNFGIIRTVMSRDNQPSTRSDVTAVKM